MKAADASASLALGDAMAESNHAQGDDPTLWLQRYGRDILNTAADRGAA